MIAAARHGGIDLPLPQKREEATAWLEAMAEEAMSDGKLAAAEYQLLQYAGRRAGLNDYDLKLLIKRVRGEMYASAKDALRNARNN